METGFSYLIRFYPREMRTPLPEEDEFSTVINFLVSHEEECEEFLSTKAQELRERGSSLLRLTNEEGDNLLFYCLKNGVSLSVIQLLLEEHGFSKEVPNAEGKRPLVLAFEKDRKEVFTYLVQKNCSLNFAVEESFFLHYLLDYLAVVKENILLKTEMIESILLNNPQINAQNERVQTTLSLVWSYRKDIPTWQRLSLSLLAAGADINAWLIPEKKVREEPFYFSFFSLEKTEQNATFLEEVLKKADLHLTVENKTGRERKEEWFLERGLSLPSSSKKMRV